MLRDDGHETDNNDDISHDDNSDIVTMATTTSTTASSSSSWIRTGSSMLLSPIPTLPLLVLLILLSSTRHDCVAAAATWNHAKLGVLFLPPAARMKLGMDERLKQECRDRSPSDGVSFVWESTVTEGYEVATSIFQCLVKSDTAHPNTMVWFPRFDNEVMLKALTTVLNDNSERLGLGAVRYSCWPATPATVVTLSTQSVSADSQVNAQNDCSNESSTSTTATDGAAITATKDWVDNTLGRLGLCPHTVSMTKAAVGLENVGVKRGPVVIRTCQDATTTESSLSKTTGLRTIPTDAARLSAAFWKCLSEMATTPEQDLATVLLLAPSAYDHDFLRFAAVCDKLIEPTVQATGVTSLIGRAWFHPLYDTAAVGHSSILAGHALPASMVQGFVRDQQQGKDSNGPKPQDIAIANDAVRWSPHATINLLRRSQLDAAKEAEAQATNRKPNAIYANNVLRILADKTLLSERSSTDHKNL